MSETDFSKRVGWRVFSNKPFEVREVCDDGDGNYRIMGKPKEVGAHYVELVAVTENMLAREAKDGSE